MNDPTGKRREGKRMAFKILVCVKQVPCPETVEPNTDGIPGDASEWRMNHYDEYAVESALQIREKHPDVRVDALSVGPDRVRDVIRRAMAMGADRGIHIPFESGLFPDSAVIAGIVAEHANPGGYDLIITGVMSEDSMQGAVGPMIAGETGLSCAAAVISQSLDSGNCFVTAECEMEAGWVETIRLKLPALLTIQTGTQAPRYPSLSNTLRARKQEIETIFPKTETQRDRVSLVSADHLLPGTSACRILEGTADEKAVTLLRILAEKDLLR